MGKAHNRHIERVGFSEICNFVNCHISASANILYDVSDNYWKWKMKEFPKIATFKGIHDYDDSLEEYSLAAFDRRRVC